MQYRKGKANANVDALSRAFRAGATGVSLEKGGGVPWSKGDQEEKGESTEHDPMNRCQEVESKEGGRMKGVPYSERVTVNPVSGSPVNRAPEYKGREKSCKSRVNKQ